ncbi:MAG: Thiosulfate sulfurtransferase GlpE [Opitutia bacterium UBA7350]|nr:MAG: Thiosulfate sulfurtransferase GlpE [Opitutae bacterium UBA7350]
MQILRECFTLMVLTSVGCGVSLILAWSPAPWMPDEWREDGQISASEVRLDSVLWVDSRSAEDYAQGHLPGAVHLTRENWGSGVMELMLNWLENPRMIVVYCSEADCSASKRLVTRLREAVTGADIYSLEGGWEVLSR